MANITIKEDEALQGQTMLPGFEEPAPAPKAEELAKRAGKVAFQMDYMRSPEDALIAWDVPGPHFSDYLAKHFEFLVQTVATATGADPEQIRDPNRRTEKQQELLSLVAAKEQISRYDAFFASYYYDALRVLDGAQEVFDARKAAFDHVAKMGIDMSNPKLRNDYIEEYLPPVKEQAVIYFFALHDEIDPRKNGKLSADQAEELQEIFSKLDSFYISELATDPDPDDFKNVFSKIFSNFITHENPEAKAEKIIEALTVLDKINPVTHIMPNDPLTNALYGGYEIINKGPIALPLANKKGRRKEITAYTVVNFDPGNTGITITDSHLTEHERQVSEGLFSLIEESARTKRPQVFSQDQIFRAMPGGGSKPSPQQKGAITKTMEKFSRLHIQMDATEYCRAKGLIAEDQKYIVDENYLNWRRHTITTRNGKKVAQGYEILGQPIMLTYSKMTGQLISVPADFLAIEKVKQNPLTKEPETGGEFVMMNAERQAMTGYLLRRIAVMQRDLKNAKEEFRKYKNRRKKDPDLEEKELEEFITQQHTISFQTLFSIAGLTEVTKQAANRNRDFVSQVLEFWKLKGLFYDYKMQSRGRSITGVKIILEKPRGLKPDTETLMT